VIFSAAPSQPLLGVNIDHVATLRNARGGAYPDPVQAAVVAVEAGADIVTFHLREDRRHIRDDDVQRLKAALHVPLNFEAAVTDEMLGIIERTRPEHVCLVPERREEVTTEGGLDVAGQAGRIQAACERLRAAGSRVSLFIGADARQIEASARCGAPCVEFHTGAFANAWWARDAAGMHAEFHGLALWNEAAPHPYPSSTAQVAALPDVAELHIGHALVGHAVFVGLRQAVADFRGEAVRARRAAAP
jgi:pyridoxine 5-phosphate synthase